MLDIILISSFFPSSLTCVPLKTMLVENLFSINLIFLSFEPANNNGSTKLISKFFSYLIFKKSPL